MSRVCAAQPAHDRNTHSSFLLLDSLDDVHGPDACLRGGKVIVEVVERLDGRECQREGRRNG